MDKSTVKTDFIAAFWGLYEKYPIEKISVRRLCEAAGYNRSTFYNHFENVYALLEAAIDDFLLSADFSILNCRSVSELASGSKAIVSIALTQLEKFRHSISLLVKNNHQGILKERLKNLFLTYLTVDRIEEHPRLGFILEYHLSACMGVIVKWFQDGGKISEAQLADLIYAISQNGFFTELIKEMQLLEEK